MDTENNLLLNILELADELYHSSPLDTQPNSRGRPYVYPDRSMFRVATLATLKKKRKPCESYRFLRAHPIVCNACGFDVRTRRELIEEGLDPDRDLADGLQPLPCERTFRRRFPKLDRATRRQIRTLGEHLIEKVEVTDATVVSVDKKMIQAQDPLWHKKDRKKNRIPEGLRNVDTDSRWSKSAYRGWVQGYGFHVGVTATVDFPIVPFWADFTFNNQNEAKAAESMPKTLPATTRTVTGDTGYDDPDLRADIEQKDDQGAFIRKLLVPIAAYDSTPEERITYVELYESPEGKTAYRQRSVSIEPFFQRLDLLFDMEPAWDKGLPKNRSWGLLWISTYQLLMVYLHRQGKPIEQMKELLDQL